MTTVVEDAQDTKDTRGMLEATNMVATKVQRLY